MGLTPSEFWEMHLWEFNLRVHVYNETQKRASDDEFRKAHTTAVLTAQGFGGKLKRIEHYLPDEKHRISVTTALTEEEMARIDAQLEEQEKAKKHG